MAGKWEEIVYEQGQQTQIPTRSRLEYSVSDHTKIMGQCCWKLPHGTYKCPLHSYGRNPEKYEMGQHTSLEGEPQKCVGPSHLQDFFNSQPYTDFSLTKQLTNIPEQVQALSPAPGRKVKSMRTRGRIKFDLVSFPKTCKNLGASWLWMLDKAWTWSAYSGKVLGPANRIFMIIHHHIFHGSEDKVSLLKIPEGERNVQENGYFPMEVNAI